MTPPTSQKSWTGASSQSVDCGCVTAVTTLCPADLLDCLEVYALNEKGRFPQGVRDLYRKTLPEQSAYSLVPERDGCVIAAGGVSYWKRENVTVLSIGLVYPQHQGRGSGIALLLAQLALLDSKRPVYIVCIFTVEKSFAFYQRFGFRSAEAWQDGHGDKHPSGFLAVASFGIRRWRKLLIERGISVPSEGISSRSKR
jgi:predicted N-acetyltransferase YhbS